MQPAPGLEKTLDAPPQPRASAGRSTPAEKYAGGYLDTRGLVETRRPDVMRSKIKVMAVKAGMPYVRTPYTQVGG